MIMIPSLVFDESEDADGNIARRRRLPRLLGECDDDIEDMERFLRQEKEEAIAKQAALIEAQQEVKKSPETRLEYLNSWIRRSHGCLEDGFAKIEWMFTEVARLIAMFIWFGILEAISICYFPLHYVVRIGSPFLVKIFVMLGCDVNRLYPNKGTPLHIAMKEKNLRLVRYLFDHGADVNKGDDSGDTPLHDMSWILDKTLACDLINSCEDIDHVTNKSNHSLLHRAVRANNVCQVELLLEAGADIDCRTMEDYNTPLLKAAGMKNINPKIIDLLIEYNSDVNAENFGNFTPLHFAMRWGHKYTVRKLLAHGADVNALTMDDRTMLQCAANNEYVDLVEELLELGFDPDENHNFEKSAAFEAAEYGSACVCEALLRKSKLKDNEIKMPFVAYVAKENKKKLKVTLRYYAVQEYRDKCKTSQPFFADDYVDKYLKRARAELQTMKNMDVTDDLPALEFLFDLMDGEDEKVAKYAEDVNIRKAIRKWKSKLPVFYQTVKNVFQRQVKKIVPRIKTEQNICRMLQLNGPQHIVCQKIMDYLEPKDYVPGNRPC